MFGIGRLVAASILAIAVLVARAQAQDSSFMDMNMNTDADGRPARNASVGLSIRIQVLFLNVFLG
jgi:hypothetical protein